MIAGIRTLLAAAAVATLTMCAPVQPLGPNDGEWIVSSVQKSGRTREFTLNIRGDSGTWQFQKVRGGANVQDPCGAILAPVEVIPLGGDEYEFKIYGSRALIGCNDAQFTARRVDPNTFVGTFRGGTRLRIVRD